MTEKKKRRKAIGKATVIIGVLIIPLLYSYFYLGAFWDPYAKLDDVPVAVVNLDEGAEINGTQRNIGQEICDNLEEDGSLKFVFTDAEDAKSGVLNQDYYASITIPKEFSYNASTVSQDTEKLHGEIIYSANQKKNYLAAQILENAMPTIKETVNSSIDKEIVETLSDKLESVPEQMGELQDGFKQLSDGSSQLKDGAKSLDSGATELKTGSASLSDGASQVATGSTTLTNGISTLKNGTDTLNASVPTLITGVTDLNNGASKLSSGANALNTGIGTYTTGVATASSGAKELQTGITTYTAGVASASSGASQIQQGLTTYTSGVSSASTGSQKLYKGIKDASDGIDTITSSVENSQKELSGSLTTLGSGSNSVSDGLNSLNKSYSSAMDGVKQYLALYYQTGNSAYLDAANNYIDTIGKSINELANGAQDVNSGISKLSSTLVSSNKQLLGGLKQVQAGFGTESDATTLLGGSYQLSQGLQLLTNNNDSLTDGMKSLTTGLDTLTSNNSTIENGLNSLTDGLDTLTSNNKSLTDGASALASGASALANGTSILDSKAPELANGVSALAGGASQILDGANTLSGGASQVADGAKKLNNGVSQLKDGTSQLADGASALDDGINTAKDGVNESVADTNEQLKALDGLAEYSEEPVSTSTEYVQPVENYGSAFAPYFMCLSLWVGGLMIFFGIYLDYNKKIKSLTKGSNHKSLREFAFVAISCAQGICLALIIKYALGITVNNLGLLFASCVLVSITFMMIIQFFIVFTGNVGKFISLLLLILQLTSCAGTFPIETQSEFFQFINKLLPMTYSTQLFKEAISGTVGSWAGKNALVLIGFLVAFTIMNVIGLAIEKAKQEKATTQTIVA